MPEPLTPTQRIQLKLAEFEKTVKRILEAAPRRDAPDAS